MKEMNLDLESLRDDFDRRGIRHVKLEGADIDGVLRGKIVSLEKFFSAAERGLRFCDVIFGWDIEDTLYADEGVTGAHTGYPDLLARLDLKTLRMPAATPGLAHTLIDFYGENARPHPACPRNLLRGIVARAETDGFAPHFAAEYEFWLFRETPASLREKHFQKLSPLHPGMDGYSSLRIGQSFELYREILDTLEDYKIPIDNIHEETGPGVMEVALRYQPALEAADSAILFKRVLKELAYRHGLVATFMAKWSADFSGSSGHLHQSLWDSTGETNLFHDAKARDGMSALGRHYLAGLLKHAPALTAIYSPNINSYKRYTPGYWAPLTASWGRENRSANIRYIPGDDPLGTRFEFRQTAADLNPYLAIAANLASGLDGIARGLEPPAAHQGDASHQGEPLPRSLERAIELLDTSDEARSLLGDAFIDHYIQTRAHELERERAYVSDWELSRYLEGV